MNLCRACDKDFSSVKNFDRHRVGKHAYTFSPDRLDGRRCLDTEELEGLGWTLNARGQWYDPAEAAATRLSLSVQRTEA